MRLLRRSGRIRDERGFTLVEMVAVCLILGIVMAGLTTVFVSATHSQLRLDQRFQAQQTARLALDALRRDVHGACAANVGGSGSTLTLALVPTGGSTQCGADPSFPKTRWCTVADAYGGWSLYRSSGTATCDATASLEAQHLTTSAPFSTASTVPVEQFQTVTVTLPVRMPGGANAWYTLGQGLALANTVTQRTGAGTSCSTTNSSICTPGPCSYPGTACYPPTIQ